MEEIIQELLEKAKQNGSQASVILTEIQELLNGENPQIQDLLERAKQNGTQASVVLLEIEEILYGEEENLEEAKQNGSQSTTILIDLAENHSIQKYTIALIVDPSGAGTVTGDGTYSEGEEVTLVATPSEGYSFKGWYNGETLVSDNASYTLTVTEDVNLVAKFEVLRYNGKAISSSPSLSTAVTRSQSVVINTTTSNINGEDAGTVIGKVIVSGEYEGEYNLTTTYLGSSVQGNVFIGPEIQVTFDGLRTKGNIITISSNSEKEFVIESISLEWD